MTLIQQLATEIELQWQRSDKLDMAGFGGSAMAIQSRAFAMHDGLLAPDPTSVDDALTQLVMIAWHVSHTEASKVPDDFLRRTVDALPRVIRMLANNTNTPLPAFSPRYMPEWERRP